MTPPIFSFFQAIEKTTDSISLRNYLIFVDNYCVPLLFPTPTVLPSVDIFDQDFEQDLLKHCVIELLFFVCLFFIIIIIN